MLDCLGQVLVYATFTAQLLHLLFFGRAVFYNIVIVGIDAVGGESELGRRKNGARVATVLAKPNLIEG
jgi:hypothetical protein